MSPTTDDPLVSTDWLAARLDDPKTKIIDASFKLPGVLPLPVDDYLAAHLPGAVFFDVDHIADRNDARPHMFPSPEQFARDVAALGISSGDTVVVYDAGGDVEIDRAWNVGGEKIVRRQRQHARHLVGRIDDLDPGIFEPGGKPVGGDKRIVGG